MKKGVHILVVDDEPVLRDTVKLLLEHDGHKVQVAHCGEAALTLLAQHHFDLIITDYSMPGMHGDQVAARARQSQPGLPIIMATAFAEEFKVFGQVPGNVDVLLQKPFSLQELHEAMEQVLPLDGGDQTDALTPMVKPADVEAPKLIPPMKTKR